MSEVFTCDKGAFALTGYSVSFITEMSLAKGAFALTGYSLAMVPALVAVKGAFSLTGYTTDLRAGESLTCANGSFALTGYSLTISEPGRLACETAYFRVTGYRLRELGDLDKSVTTTVTIGGAPIDPIRVSVSIDEGGFWVGEIGLKNATDYGVCTYDAAVSITIGSQAWTMQIDRRSRDRQSSVSGLSESWTAYAISTAADYDTPRATTVTKTWTTADDASDIADELLGSVSWNIHDWEIPGGRLAADDGIPVAIVRQIAEAVGGILRIEPNGSFTAVYEFPFAANRISTAPADITLTEAENVYTLSETLEIGKPFDQVRVYNQDGAANASDQLTWIPDADNPKHGTMRATLSPWRGGISLLCRDTGIVIGPGATTLRTIEDEPVLVSYGATNAANPIGTLTSYTVDGNVSSTLARDAWGSTAITASEDTLIFSASITYQALSLDFEVTFPDWGDYLIQLQDDETGTGLDVIDVECTRDGGTTSGPDVLEPLLSDDEGAKQRGRTEIDRASRHEIRTISCDFQPTIRNGWIARSKDTQLGEFWQGKVESIRHVAENGSATTELEIWRPI